MKTLPARPRKLPPPREMYAALTARDSSYEGVFVVGVRTTGIFCRPTCPAKKPLFENVEFFADVEAAAAAGFRACLRCRPLEASAVPRWVRELAEEVESHPHGVRVSDFDLRERGLDPVRVRRAFRTHYGMTFHAFQRAGRMGFALERLREGAQIDGVALDTGFESTSGFRDAFERVIGTTPGRARGHGALTSAMVTSPLGPMIAVTNDDGVCFLEFVDRRSIEKQIRTLARWFGNVVVPGRNTILERLVGELDEYFRGERHRFDVPLCIAGTEFQLNVWNELLAISYGETRSYEALAQAIGRPNAQRAVGLANGANRLAVLVPCHRVIQKNGQLRGYGGGLWRKQYLLDLERGQAQERP